MDAKQFDRVAKVVGQGMARRRLLAGVFGASLAGVAGPYHRHGQGQAAAPAAPRHGAGRHPQAHGKKCTKDAQCNPMLPRRGQQATRLPGAGLRRQGLWRRQWLWRHVPDGVVPERDSHLRPGHLLYRGKLHRGRSVLRCPRTATLTTPPATATASTPVSRARQNAISTSAGAARPSLASAAPGHPSWCL